MSGAFGFGDLAFLGGLTRDPNFANVSLLLHGNGTNGSTTIIDSSPTPKTVTTIGNAQISTAIADPFGNSTGVIAFDGSQDALRYSSDPAFGWGTEDFTVEFWLYYQGGNGYRFFWIQANPTPTIPYLGYGLNLDTKRPWLWNNGDVLTASTSITNDAWQHHAVVRSSGIVSIYLNGTSIGSTAFAFDLTASKPFSIGDNGNLAQTVNGYIDDLRITKGVARYTANFTPPTAPFPDI